MEIQLDGFKSLERLFEHPLCFITNLDSIFSEMAALVGNFSHPVVQKTAQPENEKIW